jgi:hypothetical protein
MSRISYRRHRFPPSVIQRAVWLYFRFPLSTGDVEEMMAERGIEVSYETVRRWVLKFGPAIAADVRSAKFNYRELGTLMRFLSALVAGGHICGTLLTMKARFLMSWPNLAETNVRSLNLCRNS